VWRKESLRPLARAVITLPRRGVECRHLPDWRYSQRLLLLSKRDARVDVRGSPDRNDARDGHDREKQQRDAGQRRGIVRGHAEEHGAGPPRRELREPEPDGQARDRQPDTAANNQANDLNSCAPSARRIPISRVRRLTR